MKFQLVSTQLIIESKSQVLSSLLLPGLQAIILRTARHLPCFMFSHPDDSLSRLSRARSCIVHRRRQAQLLSASIIRQQPRSGTRCSPTRDPRVSTRHFDVHSKFVLLSNASTTDHGHQLIVVFQWLLSYSIVYNISIPRRFSPPREKALHGLGELNTSVQFACSPTSATCSVPPAATPALPSERDL